MTNFAVCIAAGGIGTRMGRRLPKQYLRIEGLPVLVHTVRVFEGIRTCRRIVIAAENPDRVRTLISLHAPMAPVIVVEGGERRQDSVEAALSSVESRHRIVLIHDAARPCTRPALIRRVADAAAVHGAAIAATPASDTIKKVDGDRIVETVDRSPLWMAQTPQAARRELWDMAFHYARARGLQATDDASLLEAMGVPVHVVCGDRDNIKITTPEDLRIAADILRGRGMARS